MKRKLKKSVKKCSAPNSRLAFLLVLLVLSSAVLLSRVGLFKVTTSSSAKNPSSNTCSAVRGYVNPASADSGSPVTFTFTADSAYTYVKLDAGKGMENCGEVIGAKCDSNPIDGKRCWWRWECTANKSYGRYTATFSNAEGCSKKVSYTVRRPSACAEIEAYVNPNPVKTGGTVSFTFTSDRGYTSVSLNPSSPAKGIVRCGDVASLNCVNNPVDGNRCWWRWDCTVVSSASAGTYTAVFTNAEKCSKSAKYKIVK